MSQVRIVPADKIAGDQTRSSSSISPLLFTSAAATTAALHSQNPYLGIVLLQHSNSRITYESYVRANSLSVAWELAAGYRQFARAYIAARAEILRRATLRNERYLLAGVIVAAVSALGSMIAAVARSRFISSAKEQSDAQLISGRLLITTSASPRNSPNCFSAP